MFLNAARRTVQALAQEPELHLRTILEPGDIQWVHNTTMMHTRDGFTDGEVRPFNTFPGFFSYRILMHTRDGFTDIEVRNPSRRTLTCFPAITGGILVRSQYCQHSGREELRSQTATTPAA